MKKYFKVFITILITLSMLCLVIYPERYTSIALQGVVLWATAVLPSLFPFFFFTLLLTKLNVLSPITKKFDKLTQRAFRCNGTLAYVFIMSILSGYPVGARLIAELYDKGNIDKDEATRMSVICSTSGPLFILGTVGVNMFGSKALGLSILLSHIISAVICGKIFYRFGDFKNNYILNKTKNSTDNILYESIYSSVISILCVGGFICVFYLISIIVKDFKLLHPLELLVNLLLNNIPNKAIVSEGFIYGLIECTSGCKTLSSLPSPLTASLSCAIISFGGASIIFQSIIYLSKANVNMKIFLLSKVLQMIISFTICIILSSALLYFT